MGKIIGIDLGTTTSEMAYIKNGKPVMIPNGSSNITPSVVGLDDDLEIIVGELAKHQIILKPERTIREVKRKMGSGEAVIMAGKKFTPIEISAFILKDMKRVAENFLQEEVTEAVITVPANFNDLQRQSTKEAGEKAGFIVNRIINEPTAAALAYGIDNMNAEGKILVYDLGGGTFDVTILEMIEGTLDVKASRGENHLGGADFDQKIVDFLLNDFNEKNGYDLKNDELAMQRLKDEAEKAKILLSNKERVVISIPYISNKNGIPLHLETTLTKSQYETMIEELVVLSEHVVEEALRAANCNSVDIDMVLAVGGSSRTPKIMDMLKNKFGNNIQGGVNPDEAVALGAATQAGINSKEITGDDSIMIFDVCNHTLGTDVIERISSDEIRDGIFDRLIERDTHLPYSKKKVYLTSCDDQTEVLVGVYQGENRFVKDNIKIGEFLVSDIPPNEAGKEEIVVEFKYNLNGMLEVNVTCLSTGKVHTEVFRMLDYNTPVKSNGSGIDENWKNYSLSSEIKTTILLYQKKKDQMDVETRKEIDGLVRELKQAVIDNNREALEKLDDQITALLFEF